MTGDRSASGGDRLADGRYVAVLDRFEETDPTDDRATDPARDGRTDGERDAAGEARELAVLLLESEGEVVAERHVPRWRLPADARRQDAVVEVSIRNGFVVSTTFDPDATEQRTDAAQSRFDRLAKRPGEESRESSGEESTDASDE